MHHKNNQRQARRAHNAMSMRWWMDGRAKSKLQLKTNSEKRMKKKQKTECIVDVHKFGKQEKKLTPSQDHHHRFRVNNVYIYDIRLKGNEKQTHQPTTRTAKWRKKILFVENCIGWRIRCLTQQNAEKKPTTKNHRALCTSRLWRFRATAATTAAAIQNNSRFGCPRTK